MSTQSDLILHPLSIVALLAAACGEPPTGLDGGGRPDAAEPDAARDAGVPNPDGGLSDSGPGDAGCPSYSHPENGACATNLSWQDFAPGPFPRDHHVTFLQARENAATLYVSGGVDLAGGLVTNDLWSATVADDGSVSPWSLGPTPPVPQMGASLVVRPDRVYVVSGRTFSGGQVQDTAEIFSLALAADGAPEGWRAERSLPMPTFHGTAERVDRWIFVIGGIAAGAEATTGVWRTEVQADGRLSALAAVTELPEGRTHHASFVHERNIFVVGGLDGSGIGFASTSYRDYLRARIDDDGEVSAWTKETLPFGMSTHSATLLDDRVILAGGFNQKLDIADTVRIASIVDGRLEEFETLTPLPFPRAHVHHMPRWRGWLFTVGGNIGNLVAVDRASRGTLE